MGGKVGKVFIGGYMYVHATQAHISLIDTFSSESYMFIIIRMST